MRNVVGLIGLFCVGVLGACGGDTTSADAGSAENTFNREAIYTVWPVSAEIDATNNGIAWDDDGSPPDVYVSFQCPGGAVVETAVSESYTPTWNAGTCSAKAGDLIDTGVVYTMYDYDALSANDTIKPATTARWTEHFLTSGTVIFTPTSGGAKKSTWHAVKQ